MSNEGRAYRVKHFRRPSKWLAEKVRRYKVHRRRLVAQGLPEDQVAKMDPVKMRELLRHPKKLAK